MIQAWPSMFRVVQLSTNYRSLQTPRLLGDTEKDWTSGALFVQHAFHRDIEDVRHAQPFSCSVICKTSLPIRSYCLTYTHLWIRLKDVNVRLAFDDDIGRMGYGKNMCYNKDLYSTLKDALGETYQDKWVEGVQGTSFVSIDTDSVAKEILTSSQSKDRYNEIVVSWKSDPPPFWLVVYYSSDTSNDELMMRYDQAVEDAEFLNANVSSIAFVNYLTGGFTRASRFGHGFTSEESTLRRRRPETRGDMQAPSFKARAYQEEVREDDPTLVSFEIMKIRSEIEQLKRERDRLLAEYANQNA